MGYIGFNPPKESLYIHVQGANDDLISFVFLGMDPREQVKEYFIGIIIYYNSGVISL